MNEILISVISMAGLGIFFALILAAADKTMSVKEDKKVSDIEEILPGLNCGACGYAGCHAFAIALINNNALVNACLAGGEDLAEKLASFLGVEKGACIKSIAVLHCNAGCTQRNKKAEYSGIKTCQAANRIFGGALLCNYGCLGYGDCKTFCPVDAIKMADGLPVVDSTKCISCGKCVKACPKALYTIEKFEISGLIAVACNSHDKAALVRAACGVGCIGCKLCEKLSNGAFSVKDNLADFSYNRAKPNTDWNKVIEKCPTKVIVKIT